CGCHWCSAPFGAAALFVINLPPALRTETDGIEPVLIIARDAIVLVAVAVDPGMRLAGIGGSQPLLLVGLSAGMARQARGDGQATEAGDGCKRLGEDGHAPSLVSCLTHF